VSFFNTKYVLGYLYSYQGKSRVDTGDINSGVVYECS
jgi:hypothetical protein